MAPKVLQKVCKRLKKLVDEADGMGLLDTEKFNQGKDYTDTPNTGNWYFTKTGTVGSLTANAQFGTSTATNLPPYLAVYIWKRSA